MLDPKRLALDAESIGFQKRMRQDVDYDAFRIALQTDYNNQGSAVQVRREKATPVNEIHIMGGERSGFESNELIKTRARQERQINGYPLRHFDANNPAIILPKKYGGFPLYNRNQIEYPELVSVFTEPMSAPLQRNTELLGRMGAVAISNSLNTPFEEEGFVNPLKQSYNALQQNQNVFKQQKHLQIMSQKAKQQKYNLPAGPKGIFISKNGQPMSGVSDQITDKMPQSNTFSDANLRYQEKAAMQQHLYGGESGEIQMDGSSNTLGMYSSNQRQKVVAVTANDSTPNIGGVMDVNLADNAYMLLPEATEKLASYSYTPVAYNATPSGRANGLQPNNLYITEEYGGPEKTPTVQFKAHRRLSFSETKGGVPRQQQTTGFAVRERIKDKRKRTENKGTFTSPKTPASKKKGVHTLSTSARTESPKGFTKPRSLPKK